MNSVQAGSNLRRVLRNLVPPLFVATFRQLFRSNQSWTWDGSIYSSLRDVPTRNGTYNYGERIHEMATQASELLAQLRTGTNAVLWHEVLSTVSAVASAATNSVKVLDFGGGIGTGFIQLLATLPGETTIEYQVIDLEGICEAGRKVFESEPRIQFSTLLGKADPPPDIVYVNSVIQYIEDYTAQLRELTALRAPWLLLARAAVGDVPTFATRQLNLPGQVLPYWFLNRDEVINILSDCGYRKVLESICEREYDQRNLPETHRIGRMRNLLFAREDAIRKKSPGL